MKIIAGAQKKLFGPLAIYFRYLALVTLLLPLVTLSSPEWTNVKTVGGNVQECSATDPGPLEISQPLSMKLTATEKQSRSLIAEFEIQFLSCKKNGWAVVKNVTNDFSSNFKDEIGQVQSEKINFSHYRLQVRDKDGKIIQSFPVEAHNQNSKLKFHINVNTRDLTIDDSTKTKYVDVILIADRIRQTSSDRYFDEVNWGVYRLSLSTANN